MKVSKFKKTLIRYVKLNIYFYFSYQPFAMDVDSF